MKNKKKVLNKKLIIFLIVLIVILLVSLAIIKKLFGEESIFEKMNSGIYKINYSYTTNDGDIVYIVGTWKKIEYANGNIEYIDYKTKENYLLDEEGKLIKKTSNNGITDMEYYIEYSPYFNNNAYNYSYKGKEEYNGSKCKIIEFVSKEGYSNAKTGGQEQKGGVRLWINDELNILEKVEHFYIENNERNSLFEKEYEYHTNLNSVDDVKIPDNIKNNY